MAIENKKNKSTQLPPSSKNLENSNANFLLGLHSAKGKGVPQDLEKAAEYFRDAAEGGHKQAISCLSLCCLESEKIAATYGNFVEKIVKNESESMHARFYVALSYLTGKNKKGEYGPVYANRLLYSIWTSGHVQAQYLLGMNLYHTPNLILNNVYDFNDFPSYSPEIHGTRPSDKAYFLAEKVMRVAAKQGNDKNAQFALGMFLLKGIGGVQNFREAYSWFQEAEKQGNEKAKVYVELFRPEYEAQLTQAAPEKVKTVLADFVLFAQDLPELCATQYKQFSGISSKLDEMFSFENPNTVNPVSTVSSSSSTTSMPEAKAIEMPESKAPENKQSDWRVLLFGSDLEPNNSSVIFSQTVSTQESKVVKLETIKAVPESSNVISSQTTPVQEKEAVNPETVKAVPESSNVVSSQTAVQETQTQKQESPKQESTSSKAKGKRQPKQKKEKGKKAEPEIQESDSKRELSPPIISWDEVRILLKKAEQGLDVQEIKQLKAWFDSEKNKPQDADGYCWLGRYCETVSERAKSAFDFYQKAVNADKTHPEANYRLGVCYENKKAYFKDQPIKNLQLALEHYQIAAEKEHELAKTSYARLEAEKMKKAEAKKKELEEKAKASDQSKQEEETREQKFEAKSEHPGESAYQEARKLLFIYKIDEYTKKFKIAADLGHLPAALHYGGALASKKATQEAEECFDKLRGHPFFEQMDLDAPGAIGLGYRYRLDVLKQSPKECLAWLFQKAVETRDPEAQFLVGIYHYNRGGYQEAIIWLDRAKKQEVDILDPAINAHLGLCFLKTNKEKAAEYFTQAAEQGVPIAQIQLKMKSNYDEAQRLAASGDINGVVELGKCYWDGIWVNRDLEQAEAYLNQAAKAGNESGQTLLKEFYAEEGGAALKEYALASNNYETFKPEEKSYTVAIQYLKKAADAGFLEANYIYAGFLYSVQDSKDEIEKDYTDIVTYLERYKENKGTRPNAQALLTKCINEMTSRFISRVKITKPMQSKQKEKIPEQKSEVKSEYPGELAFQEGRKADALAQTSKAVEKYKEAADAGHPIGNFYYAHSLVGLNKTEEARPYLEKAREQKTLFLENLEIVRADRLFVVSRYYRYILKDEAKADEYFKQAVEANSVEAQIEIAVELYHKQDYAQAAQWFIKAERQNKIIFLPKVLFHLGLCCLEGWKDKTGQYDEFSCIQSAAKSGHATSQYQLGDLYQKRNAPGDLKRAFESYGEAAASEDSFAYLALAKCYRDGLGTNIDLVKAKQWFMKVGSAGDWEPLMEFSLDIFRKGEHAYECGQEKMALSYFLAIGGENGVPGANIYLGRIYETGYGVSVDPQKAEFYYGEAHKNSEFLTGCGLAQLTLFTDKSEEKAISLFESVSKNESDPVIRARAEYYLALCYKNTNPEISSEYMKKAAKNENPMALYDLACEQIRTAGVNDLAIGHLRKAADQGHLKAQYLLADLLCDQEQEKSSVKDFSEVIKYCNLAIAHPDAQKLFAKCEAAIEAQTKTQTQSTDSPSDEKNIEEIFKKGENAFERRQDRLTLLHLLPIGGDDGYPPANVYLGRMYEEGWGVKKDSKIADSYYKKAQAKSDWFLKPGRELQLAQYNQFSVKHKNPEKEIVTNYKKVIQNDSSSKESRARAQYCLGAYYSKAGEAKEAKKYYDKAAKANHPSALADLGNDKTLTLKEKHVCLEKAVEQRHAVAAYTMAKYFYDIGKYTKVTPYLPLAADLNNEDARLFFGKCYCEGRGVLINYKKAKELLLSAVTKGNEEAIKLLKECQSKVAHFSKESATHTTTSSVSGLTLDETSAVPEAKGSSVDQVFEVEHKTTDMAGVGYGDILGCLPEVTTSETPFEDQGAQVQNLAQTDWFSSRRGGASSTTSASSNTSSSSMEPPATLK